mmetsp:Transcript_35340/g.102066  ORF Transcript_35340/g.102066 Transcript_35340/m.102066 type:complete len:208 (+) Transcript_35340:421-1044(+)
MTTMVCPWRSGWAAISKAAAQAAPDDGPTERPSCSARRFAMAMPFEEGTSANSSMTAGYFTPCSEASIAAAVSEACSTSLSMSGRGMPTLIPTSPCEAGRKASLPARTRDSAASTQTMCTSGLCCLRKRAMPDRVPPVPAPATTTSTRPEVCDQISGPVPTACASELSGLANCRKRKPPGFVFAISSAIRMKPFAPSEASLSWTSAP